MGKILASKLDNQGFTHHSSVSLNAPTNYIVLKFQYDPAMDTPPFLPMDDLHIDESTTSGGRPLVMWRYPETRDVVNSIEEHMYYAHVNRDVYSTGTPSTTGLRGQNVVAEYSGITLRCYFKNGTYRDIENFDKYTAPDKGVWVRNYDVPIYPIDFRVSDLSPAYEHVPLGEYDPAYVHPFTYEIGIRLGTWFGGTALVHNVTRESYFMQDVDHIEFMLMCTLWTVDSSGAHKTGNYFVRRTASTGSMEFSSSVTLPFRYAKYKDQHHSMKYYNSIDSTVYNASALSVIDDSCDYTIYNIKALTAEQFNDRYFVCYPQPEGPIPEDYLKVGNSCIRVIFRHNIKGLGFPVNKEFYKAGCWNGQTNRIGLPTPCFVTDLVHTDPRKCYYDDYWRVSGAWRFSNEEENRVDCLEAKMLESFGSTHNSKGTHNAGYYGGLSFNGNSMSVSMPVECFFGDDTPDESKLPDGVSINGDYIYLASGNQNTHFASFVAIDLAFNQEDDSFPSTAFTGNLSMSRNLAFIYNDLGTEQLPAGNSHDGTIIPRYNTAPIVVNESALVWHRSPVKKYAPTEFSVGCTHTYVTTTTDTIKYKYHAADVKPTIPIRVNARVKRNVGYRIEFVDSSGRITCSTVFPTTPGNIVNTDVHTFDLTAPTLSTDLNGFVGDIKLYTRTGESATDEELVRTVAVYFVGEYYEQVNAPVTALYLNGDFPTKVVNVETTPATSLIDELLVESSNTDVATVTINDHAVTVTQVATGRCDVLVYSSVYPASRATITVISGTTETGGADDEPDDYTNYPVPTDPEDPLPDESRAQHAYFYDLDWRTSQLKQHCGGFDHGIGRGDTHNAAPGTLYIVYSEHSKREYFRDGVRTEGMEDQIGKYIPTPLLQGDDTWHTDYEAPAFLDTGNISDRNGSSNKRFREVQYLLSLDGDTDMQVAFAFLVDGAMRRPMFKPVAVYDADTDTITVSTEYDEPYSVAESVVGNLDAWTLDAHTLENAERVRVRQNVTGKGITASTRIVFKMSGQFKLLGVNYVYREMYSR